MSNPQPSVAFGDLFNFELAGKVIIPNLKYKQVPDKRALDSKEELKTKSSSSALSILRLLHRRS